MRASTIDSPPAEVADVRLCWCVGIGVLWWVRVAA